MPEPTSRAAKALHVESRVALVAHLPRYFNSLSSGRCLDHIDRDASLFPCSFSASALASAAAAAGPASAPARSRRMCRGTDSPFARVFGAANTVRPFARMPCSQRQPERRPRGPQRAVPAVATARTPSGSGACDRADYVRAEGLFLLRRASAALAGLSPCADPGRACPDRKPCEPLSAQSAGKRRLNVR